MMVAEESTAAQSPKLIKEGGLGFDFKFPEYGLDERWSQILRRRPVYRQYDFNLMNNLPAYCF